MGYLGTPIDTNNTFQSLQGKRFSGNGSTTAFTLDIAPASTLDIEVFVENVRQDPNSAYSLSGTTLTFAAAPDAGTNNIYVVHQAKAVATISAGAGTVNAASMDNTVISGHDALAAEPADTDEFLVSDAGTIKRIDYSLIKASNTPAFSVKLSGNQSINHQTWTKVTLSAEDYDTDSAFASNKFTVPSGKAGKYFFHYNLGSAASLDDGERLLGALYKNGSKLSEYSTSNDRSPTGNVDNFINNSITLALDAADYIELYVYHSEGAAMNVLANSCLLQGHRLIGV